MSARLPTVVFLLIAAPTWAAAQSNRPDGRSPVYYPDAVWQHKTPSESGLDPARLKEATDFAVANETGSPRDLVLNHYQTFGREPFGYAIGPIKDRGDPTGLIIHHGYIVAEWGEPLRVDMAHSVTKSMLSSVIGVAYDRGMIRDISDIVRDYMAPIQVFSPLVPGNKSDRLGAADLLSPFDTPHNRTITWDHMLRQTSDWEGTLWGKPDWADRPESNTAQWTTRPRHQPGTVYKYNDVRVNALALAALNVWRRPLPQVLKETIMDPISAYDMGRFGYLTLRRGKWKDRQLLSDKWVDWALTPTPAQPTYGFMNWFLNTNRQLLPSAPASAFVHIGNGTNMIFVDPEHDLVAVARWIDGGAMDGFVKRLLASAKVM